MAIIQRRYKLLDDFKKVLKYLTDIYNFEKLDSYLLPQFFEYAHTHPHFNHKLTHRFGIWEENNEIVGMACYEMDNGECFITTKNGYQSLLPEIVKYAEGDLGWQQ